MKILLKSNNLCNQGLPALFSLKIYSNFIFVLEFPPVSIPDLPELSFVCNFLKYKPLFQILQKQVYSGFSLRSCLYWPCYKDIVRVEVYVYFQWWFDFFDLTLKWKQALTEQIVRCVLHRDIQNISTWYLFLILADKLFHMSYSLLDIFVLSDEGVCLLTKYNNDVVVLFYLWEYFVDQFVVSLLFNKLELLFLFINPRQAVQQLF